MLIIAGQNITSNTENRSDCLTKQNLMLHSLTVGVILVKISKTIALFLRSVSDSEMKNKRAMMVLDHSPQSISPQNEFEARFIAEWTRKLIS